MSAETYAATGQPVGQDGGGPAPDGAPSRGPGFGTWMPLILVFMIFWLLVIAPQGRERKKRAAMLEALKKDDNVMSTGGLYGRVANIDGDVVTLIVADGVRMRFHRQSIQTVLVDSRTSDEAPTQAGR